LILPDLGRPRLPRYDGDMDNAVPASETPPLADGRHFTVEEMKCHDGTPYPAEWGDRLATLFGVMDMIRDAWGGPLTVVSGYRSPAHNQALIEQDEANGSHQVASGSQHIEGRAADLRTANGPQDVPQLMRVINQLYSDGKIPALGGIGDYPTSNWVHIDVRPQAPLGHVARWRGV
jgi:uncharacterized protein YcbK (DUF882 family)